MTLTIVTFSIGQLVRQRRTLVLVLLAALPVALALLFRVTGGSAEERPDFAAGILAHFVVTLVLPLVALVIGTAAIGQELEDGTVVYLIAKPLPRWKVILAKVGAAWIVTGSIVMASVIASGLILVAGTDHVRLVPAFVAAVLLGSLAYAAIFVTLSIRFGRALIIGLAYVFVWESLISQFIVGVRFFSVSAYTTSVAEALARSSSELLESPLGVTPALVLMALVIVLSTWYGIRRLNAYQMSERV
jgi:ABC-2 type transport system permease protein